MKLILRLLFTVIPMAIVCPQVSMGQNRDAAPSRAIGTNWPLIVDSLKRSGLSRVGDLDLNQLSLVGSRAVWVEIKGVPKAVQSGSRQSAYYQDGDSVIHYSSALRLEAPQALEALELHEVFRFSHFNDDDYSLTTALSLLAKVPRAETRNRLARLYGERYFRSTFMLAMGGTSVSGGGDFATLAIKKQIIENILSASDDRAPVSDDFLSVYPSIGFEPLKNPALRQVYIDYKVIFQPVATERLETFTVFIPVAQWNAGGASRADVIQEATRKITALFQVSANSASRTFRPESCSSNRQVVTYPATTDQAAWNIQNVRGSLQLGCRQLIKGQTSLEVVAPSLPSEVEPERAGRNYFDCTFKYGSSTFSKLNVVPRGISMSVSDSWSLEYEDYLDGEIIVSQTGDLISTGITYKPVGSSAYIRAQSRANANGYGKAAMQVKGQLLTFECQKRN